MGYNARVQDLEYICLQKTENHLSLTATQWASFHASRPTKYSASKKE